MKNILIILFILLSFSSCKKDDYAADIKGIWQNIDTESYYKFTDNEIFISSDMKFDKEAVYEYAVKGRELHEKTHSRHKTHPDYDGLVRIYNMIFKDENHLHLKFKRYESLGKFEYNHTDIYLKRISSDWPYER